MLDECLPGTAALAALQASPSLAVAERHEADLVVASDDSTHLDVPGSRGAVGLNRDTGAHLQIIGDRSKIMHARMYCRVKALCCNDLCLPGAVPVFAFPNVAPYNDNRVQSTEARSLCMCTTLGRQRCKSLG
jgi:hypothetical protein